MSKIEELEVKKGETLNKVVADATTISALTIDSYNADALKDAIKDLIKDSYELMATDTLISKLKEE